MKREFIDRTARTIYVNAHEWQAWQKFNKLVHKQNTSERIRSIIESDLHGKSAQVVDEFDFEAASRELTRISKEENELRRILQKDQVFNAISDFAFDSGVKTDYSNVEDKLPKMYGYTPTENDRFTVNQLLIFCQILRFAKKRTLLRKEVSNEYAKKLTLNKLSLEGSTKGKESSDLAVNKKIDAAPNMLDNLPVDEKSVMNKPLLNESDPSSRKRIKFGKHIDRLHDLSKLDNSLIDEQASTEE